MAWPPPDTVLDVPIPWMGDADLRVTIRRTGPRRAALLVTRITEEKVCEFRDGEVIFLRPCPAGLSDTERLCLSVMPASWPVGNPERFPEVLRDPFWQMLLDVMKVQDVMAV